MCCHKIFRIYPFDDLTNCKNCKFVNRFLRLQFKFFLRIYSTLGQMRLKSKHYWSLVAVAVRFILLKCILLVIPRSPAFRKRRMPTFFHFSMVVCLYTAFNHPRCISSYSFVFLNPTGVSWRPATNVLLISFTTVSSFSSVNCLGLITSWLLTFLICLLGTSSRFLKCAFHFWRHYFWLADLILLSRCFSYHLLPLLSALTIVIVCLGQIFWF